MDQNIALDGRIMLFRHNFGLQVLTF